MQNEKIKMNNEMNNVKFLIINSLFILHFALLIILLSPSPTAPANKKS